MYYEKAGSSTNLFTVEKTTGKIRVANSLLFAPTKVQVRIVNKYTVHYFQPIGLINGTLTLD